MSFKQLALIEPLNRAVSELGYTNPTSIQLKAIPLILNGHDLLGSAQTGTGKTASFVLPILQKASQQTQTSRNRAKVLILTPTRELAIQAHESIIQYGKYLTLRSAVIYGGVKSHNQIKQLDQALRYLLQPREDYWIYISKVLLNLMRLTPWYSMRRIECWIWGLFMI